MLSQDIAKAVKQKLDEEELEMVRGGTEVDVCLIKYTCFTIICHPDDTRPEDACLFDYNCLLGMI